MFLWTQAFTLAAAYFVTVGAVAQWYWKMDKKEVCVWGGGGGGVYLHVYEYI